MLMKRSIVTHKDKEADILYVIDEPPGRCEICGAVAETRPYGPDGQEVCFKCGMKDENAAKQKFQERLDS